MIPLTRQQRQVVASVVLLLAVGWAVKAWRLAHPRSSAGPAEHELHAEGELRGTR